MITADVSMVTVLAGSVASLRCTATGDPLPVQSWARNGTAVVSGSRFQITDGGRVLTVSSVTEEDGGVYTCHASNTIGTDSSTVVLNVQCKKLHV